METLKKKKKGVPTKSRGDGDEKERELECEGERSPKEREQGARGGLRFGGFLLFGDLEGGALFLGSSSSVIREGRGIVARKREGNNRVFLILIL